MSDQNDSRRKFLKAAAYTVPVILTLKAAPSFAKSGSMHGKKRHKMSGPKHRPKHRPQHNPHHRRHH